MKPKIHLQKSENEQVPKCGSDERDTAWAIEIVQCKKCLEMEWEEVLKALDTSWKRLKQIMARMKEVK